MIVFSLKLTFILLIFLLIIQEVTPLNSSELNSFLGNEQSIILSAQIPSHTQMPQYLQHADGGGHYQLSLVDLPLQVLYLHLESIQRRISSPVKDLR